MASKYSVFKGKFQLKKGVIYFMVMINFKVLRSTNLRSIHDRMDYFWNEFWWMLSLSKHIHGVYNYNWHLVCIFIGDSKLFSCSLNGFDYSNNFLFCWYQSKTLAAAYGFPELYLSYSLWVTPGGAGPNTSAVDK